MTLGISSVVNLGCIIGKLGTNECDPWNIKCCEFGLNPRRSLHITATQVILFDLFVKENVIPSQVCDLP